MMASMIAEARFDELIVQLLQSPGVTPPGTGRGFGSSGLRVDGKIFAMLVRGRLVVKLPASRVDGLVVEGAGERFDANKGTPMREWIAIDSGSDLSWTALARDALEFVRGDRRDYELDPPT
jgi:hypothetical protein